MKDADARNITDNLNRLMAEHDWKRATLLAKLSDEGFQYRDVSVEAWLKGETVPETRTMPALARIFEVSIDELYAPLARKAHHG